MWKTLVAVIVALALGAATGAYLFRAQLTPRLAAMAGERDSLQHEITALREESRKETLRFERIEHDNEMYLDEIDGLYGQLDAARALASRAPDAVGDGGEDPEDSLDLADFLGPWLIEAAAEEHKENSGGANSRNKREKDSARVKEGPKRGAYLEGTDDPVAQDRLATIREYAAYIQDLKRRMREATTDEERAQLQREMIAADREMNALVREQKRYMVSQLAERYGVVGEDRQKEFISDVRRTMQHRFFRWQDGEIERGKQEQGRGKKPGKQAGQKRPKK